MNPAEELADIYAGQIKMVKRGAEKWRKIVRLDRHRRGSESDTDLWKNIFRETGKTVDKDCTGWYFT